MTLKYVSSSDLDAIADPIMKAKMVALKGINKVMAQSTMGMPPVPLDRWVAPPHAWVASRRAELSRTYEEYMVAQKPAF